MPKSPDTSTIVEAAGQYRATIPKPLAEQLELEGGQKVRWRSLGKGRLEMSIVDNHRT